MPDFPMTEQEGHSHRVCPSCHAELCGGPIPHEHRDVHYGGSKCYGREVGIYAFDRTLALVCPECDYTVPRYPELWNRWLSMEPGRSLKAQGRFGRVTG